VGSSLLTKDAFCKKSGLRSAQNRLRTDLAAGDATVGSRPFHLGCLPRAMATLVTIPAFWSVAAAILKGAGRVLFSGQETLLSPRRAAQRSLPAQLRPGVLEATGERPTKRPHDLILAAGFRHDGGAVDGSGLGHMYASTAHKHRLLFAPMPTISCYPNPVVALP